MKENNFIVNHWEIDLLFDRLDKNKDGKINFNEV